MELPEGSLPPIHNNKLDLLLDDRPEHDATVAVAYADSDAVGSMPSAYEDSVKVKMV